MIKLVASFLLLFPLVIFGQTENFWVKKNDFGGLKRERAISFSIGDFGYVGTGVDTGEVVLNDLWQYNAANDSWTQKANLPGSVRRDAVGFSIGSKGYVGTGIDSTESLGAAILKDFWEYDPQTNSWLQKADFPGGGGLGVYFSTGFSIDSKGYICCGKMGPSVYSNELWEYKPNIDQWTQRSNFPGGVRYQLASFTIENNAYVGLGATQDVYKKDFWKYNPGSNQWTAIPDLPGSNRGEACSFTIGDFGYVCLGSDGGLLADLWAYNPNANQWSIRAPYGGSERKNAVSFVVNNKAYVGTGKGYSGKKASMQEYTPQAVLDLADLSTKTLTIYPNPASTFFTIVSENRTVEKYELHTTDGRKVKEIQSNSLLKQSINCADLNPGIYILVALDHSNSIVETKHVILV
jgi:N-acetylneuraminic acid mutarotase